MDCWGRGAHSTHEKPCAVLFRETVGQEGNGGAKAADAFKPGRGLWAGPCPSLPGERGVYCQRRGAHLTHD